MKISLLQNREPIEKIIVETLKRFWHSRNEARTVAWRKDTRGDWLVNAHLNMIFTATPNSEIWQQPKKEFSTSLNRWKRPIQKLYVYLASTAPFRRLLSTASLQISPPVPQANDIVIIGGNHHLRLLNYATGTAYVINKAGFNTQFISNELSLRAKFTFLPTPRITDVAADKSWYAEEIISGTPLNRLPNDLARPKALNNIKSSLNTLYQKTSQTINANDYLMRLRESINSILKQNYLFSDEQRTFTVQFVQIIIKTIEHLSAGKIIPLTIAQTHGDFQPANILIDKEKAWLIDWEYTALRQIRFDDNVFQFGTRTTSDWATKFIHQYEQERHDSSKQIFLLVFLLEELTLRLEENNNQRFFRLDNGLNCYWKEAEKLSTFYKHFQLT